MKLRVARRLLVLLFAACPMEETPDAGPPDAGVFVPKCSATPLTGITCTDGGPCPFAYGTQVECGRHSAAAVATAAATGGKAHVLFSISDPDNVWHTQRVSLSPTEPQPAIELDLLPRTRSTTLPSIRLAASGDGAPLAFYDGDDAGLVLASFLSGTTLSPETVWSRQGTAFAGLQEVALASGGRGYAVISAPGGYQLVARGDGGTWTATPIPQTNDFPTLALGLDRQGGPHTAWWASSPDGSSLDALRLRSPGGAEVTLLTEVLRGSPTLVNVALGLDDAGAELPVVTYAHEGTHVVAPAGDGGYRKVRAPEPGVVNTCPTGVLHATCADCPNPTCTRRGESILDAALATTDDGTVFLAVLMLRTDVDAKVTAKPTTVGGIVINCDCDVDVTRDGSRTTGVVIYRVLPGGTPRLEKRTTVDVPARARQLRFEQVSGKLHVSFLDNSEMTRFPVLHYVVLDVPPLL